MARQLTASPKFKILVANLSGASDPSKGTTGNPTKKRTAFEMQQFSERMTSDEELDRAGPHPGTTQRQGLLTFPSDTPVAATGTLTVANNTFTNPAVLYLGNYVIRSGDDFTVGGSTSATATALAAAIDALPEFAASAATDDVTITGPVGPNGNLVRFEVVFEGTVENYTLDPDGGFLTGGEPTLGPVSILT